jgi:RNA recognition motif-containing protein
LANADVSQRKLFIRGLAWDTTEVALNGIMNQYGEIEESAIIHDKSTGKSKGFGFVTFKEAISAQRAVTAGSFQLDVSVFNF